MTFQEVLNLKLLVDGIAILLVLAFLLFRRFDKAICRLVWTIRPEWRNTREEH